MENNAIIYKPMHGCHLYLYLLVEYRIVHCTISLLVKLSYSQLFINQLL